METRRRFLYFPGCSLMATNRAYDISTRSVARVLGIDLAEVSDWNCCGATAYMAIREKEAFVLSARNLALAEAQAGGNGNGHPADLAVVCNGCYVALHKTEKYMAEDSSLGDDIRRALKAGGMDFRGGVRVRHFLDVVVNEVGEEEVRKRVKKPLAGLKAAAYPGCQLSRPFGEIDDPEFPVLMDRLLGWLGAETVPFALKAKCCGGLMMTTKPEIGRDLTGKILRNAKENGAACVATACPLCQINLEAYQGAVSDAVGADCRIPVFYFTQLLGAAFGLSAKDLALADNLTPWEHLLAEKTA
jgi:heterodisulfide reductase subunit B2